MRTEKIVIAALGVAALSACANLNTAYRDFKVDDRSGAMVDIKQRAIIASQHEDERGNKRTVVCAEPSPDAMSAYAAEFAAEGGNGQVGAQVTAAMQEAAAYVGLRTQSIQLMRDSFYRICEGYMSGALSETQFDILTRRHQRYMVALLGIEQLTGAVKAPAVTLTSEGQAEAGQSIASLRAQIKGKEAEIEKKTAEKAEKDTIAAKADASKEEKELAQKESNKLATEIADLQKDKAALETGIEHARGLAAGGATHAFVSPVGLYGPGSDATMAAVAAEVGKIVNTVLNTNEFEELCLNVLSKEGGVDRLVARLQSLKTIQADSAEERSSKEAASNLIVSCLDLMNKNAKEALAR